MTDALTPPQHEAVPVVTMSRHQEGPDAAVVVLDFVTFDQSGSAADLVAAALPSHRVLFADPVSDVAVAGRFVALGTLATAYAALIADLDQAPAVLAGYCSAAPLACLVREELSAQGIEIPLLLIAPGFPTLEQVDESVAEVLTSLGSSRVVTLPADTDAARTEIDRVVTESLAQAATQMGLEGVEAEILTGELGDRYLAWLGYLLATVGVDVGDVPTGSQVIALPEAHSAPESGWSEGVVVEVVDVARDAFLASPRAAQETARAASALVPPRLSQPEH